MARQLVLITLAAVCIAFSCTAPAPPPATELARYALDNLTGVITRSGVAIDPATSSDGHGSLKVSATGPTTVRLFETGDLDIEDARLTYQARLRSQDLQGSAYLEMWCRFPGQGEFFSRGLDSALSGTNDWTSQQTPFFLQPGQNPDLVKLNLVVNGPGTVWIDDIRLIKGPLQ